jgi:phage major head subunit gpT-like protein
MGVIVSENFGYLLDPGLRKIFMDEYQLPGSVIDQLYGMESSQKAVEYDYAIGGMGDLEEFSGTIPYGEFAGQYRVSYTHKEWVKGIKIERKLVDDDLYSVINKRPAMLALVAKRTREKHGASVFNNAFNTSVFAGGDGVSLVSASHTRVAPDGSTTAAMSNLGSSALSQTALSAARLAMREFVDDTLNLLNVQPDLLLVPPELEETAWVITQSEKKPGTAENDANYYKGRYKIVVWDYLADSNNWFLIDGRYAKMFLKWFNRIPVEFNKDKDFDTYISKWSTYTRYSYGFSDWSWIYGANVS